MEEIQTISDNLPVEPIELGFSYEEAKASTQAALVDASMAKNGSNALRRKQAHLAASQLNLQDLKEPTFFEKVRIILEKNEEFKDLTEVEKQIFQQYVKELSRTFSFLEKMSLEQIFKEFQQVGHIQGSDDARILPIDDARILPIDDARILPIDDVINLPVEPDSYDKKIMEHAFKMILLQLLGRENSKEYEYSKLMLSNLVEKKDELKDMGPRALQIELLMMELDAKYKVYEDVPGIPSKTPAKKYMEYIQMQMWILMEENIDDPKVWQFYEELFAQISGNLEELEKMSPDEAMEKLQEYRNQLYFDIFYIK